MVWLPGRVLRLLLSLLLRPAASSLLPIGGVAGGKKTVDPLIDDWSSEEQPKLPLDAIVIEERDDVVWSDEALEFSGLRFDPRTPRPLRAHLASFRLPMAALRHSISRRVASVSPMSSRAPRW